MIGWVLGVWRILAARCGCGAKNPLFRGFSLDSILKEKFEKFTVRCTDGCTVGHLYLSQMIFGQGDPWSLV